MSRVRCLVWFTKARPAPLGVCQFAHTTRDAVTRVRQTYHTMPQKPKSSLGRRKKSTQGARAASYASGADKSSVLHAHAASPRPHVVECVLASSLAPDVSLISLCLAADLASISRRSRVDLALSRVGLALASCQSRADLALISR